MTTATGTGGTATISPEPEQYSDLLVSTVYIIITLATAETLRKFIRSLTSLLFEEGSFPFLNTAICEFIAIFELSAVCYELNLVADIYGYTAYWIYLFVASIWWCYRWGESTGCPYTHVEEWLDGTVDLGSGAILSIVEIIGGLVFYRFFLKHLWTLEYGESHMYKVQQVECRSDIQIDPWQAACIEAGGVFVSQLVGRLMSRAGYFSSRTEIIINSALGTTLVVLAFTTSGGYFNPALATALQYGCSGATPFEHILVYWIGDISGSVIAYFLWHLVIDKLFTVIESDIKKTD